MDLNKIMIAKNVSEIHLYFTNHNNQSFEEERTGEGIEGEWTGEVTFKDGDVRVEVDIPFGQFEQVVKDMKDIMKGTYDYEREGEEEDED